LAEDTQKITLEETLTLSVDVGSSSVRAMVFDRAGRALEGVFVQHSYEPKFTPDGGVSIDPPSICDVIFACIDSALEQAGDHAARIERVGIDTLVGNVMGMDAHGQPTTPIYTWADTRGRELGLDLKNRLAPDDYTHRTGCRIHTSYWPIRLLWLYENDRQRFESTRYWLSLGEYVLWQLFGERRISYSTASWSGLLNRHTLTWDTETLSALPIKPEQLSTISNAPFQGLSGEWASRWPALKNALWYPSVGDGVASNVGAGCIQPNHVALSIGTSGALRVIVQGTPEQTPDGLFVYRVDERRSLVGGALSNAGNLYAWLTRVMHTHDDLDASVNVIAPDSHGLTMLPFLAGERAPGWNDRAQAVFMGMNFDTTPADLVRAALEAVSYRFYQVAQRLTPLLPDNVVYVASGAPVLNSPTWMQILADVLGAPVYANAEPEATIRGTAYLAMGVDPTPRLGNRYDPEGGRHAIYQAAVQRQQDLYNRLLG
jgi:gluconokinase